MNRLPKIPRISMMFAAMALLAACTPPAADDDGETGETGETGDPVDNEACIDPGTELLPNVKPALLPTEDSGIMYTCTSGWGTDAPHVTPEWTLQVGAMSVDYNFTPPAIVAHPDGGVVVAAMGEFAHYGADGEPLWSNDTALLGQMYLAVEEAGTILFALTNWNTQVTSLTRYNADGTLVAEVPIPWNSPSPNIWGLTTFGADIVIGGNDEDSQGSWEATLMRLDVDGNLLLRKSTGQSGGNALAATDDGVLLFGTFPGFLVSLDSGAVLGMLQPTNASIGSAIAVGNEFIMAGNINNVGGDLGIGRYSSASVEQWLQSYDRATLNDFGRAAAAGADGTFVVVGGTALLDFTNVYWFGSQPVVFGVDADGNALWTDRIAAQADATAVAIGVDGDVYVAGTADAGDDSNNEAPPVLSWLRRYAP